MTTQEKFRAFTNTNYAAQAKAFLNAFWSEVEGETERIWEIYNVFVEIDFENKKEGCDLDEFSAHRVLERFGETRSVREMRDELRAVDMDFNKRVALLEYCLFTFGYGVEDFVARPQDASEELKEASEAVQAAQAALAEALAALEASTAAAKIAAEEAETASASAEQARIKAEAAQAAADIANAAAEEAQAAEAALKKALDDLQAQEEAFENQKEDLRQRSQEGGVVTRNKAANELAQLEATDPLPLLQAKLDTGAATRKAEKARIAADAAADIANESAAVAKKAQDEADDDAEKAEQSRVAAESAAADAKASADAMEAVFAEAEAKLSALAAVSGGSSGQGAIWWLEREMTEARKYAPRGGLKKN